MHAKSIWSSLAFEALRAALKQDGDICPYPVLREAMSMNPQVEGYCYVMTARKQFEHENECVLQPVRGIGIERLAPPGVVNRGSTDLRRTKRGLGRAIRRQGTIAKVEKQATLTREEKSTYLMQVSQMGILNHCMKPGASKKIRRAINASEQTLAVEETLALFQGGSK